jgi:gamma-glutamyltranspeptidase/glutathione hydrolase
MTTTEATSGWQVRKEVVRSARGVVAAQHRRAAEVGAEVLGAGGNAVDAAVATSLALSALEPWMNGLGGGGSLLFGDAATGGAFALDFGMVAPAALDPADYPLAGGTGGYLFGWPAVLEDRNLRGPLAMAVPGQAAGLALALDRFGSMPLRDLAGPAIAFAEEGLAADWYAGLLVAANMADLGRYPSTRRVWLPDGVPPLPDSTGEPRRVALPGLADTLRQLALEGPRAFYEGDLAARLLADLAEVGSRIDAADLRRYRAREADPLRVPYRDAELALMPGLYAGTTMARCLERLAPLDLGDRRPGPEAYAAYADALAVAYAERLEGMGEGSPATPSCTSHVSVIDRHGNLVALTQTLLSLFGSKVVLPRTGILMNNGVMWFDPRPGRPNSIAPGKRPLSNMCPVVATRAGAPLFALGASGGRRILPAVLQLASFLIDFRMPLDAAFAQPRLDVSGTDAVTLDVRLGSEVARAVAAAHPVRTAAPTVHPLRFACPVGVLHDPESGLSCGTAEPWQPWADAAAEA